MRKVNIYAETDIKAFESKKRMAGYLLEVTKADGRPATASEFYETEGTYNAVILEALAKALERMKEKCELHLHSQNAYVLGTIDGPNLATWEKTGFRNGKGERIKCAELWEKVCAGMQGHLVTTEAGFHSYYSWMITEMKHQKPEEKEETLPKGEKFRVWDHRLAAPKHTEARA